MCRRVCLYCSAESSPRKTQLLSRRYVLTLSVVCSSLVPFLLPIVCSPSHCLFFDFFDFHFVLKEQVNLERDYVVCQTCGLSNHKGNKRCNCCKRPFERPPGYVFGEMGKAQREVIGREKVEKEMKRKEAEQNKGHQNSRAENKAMPRAAAAMFGTSTT